MFGWEGGVGGGGWLEEDERGGRGEVVMVDLRFDGILGLLSAITSSLYREHMHT